MRESLGGMGLLAPTVLILIGLVLYPFFYAIWLAFTDKTVGSPGQFVGFLVTPRRIRRQALANNALEAPGKVRPVAPYRGHIQALFSKNIR